MADKYLPYWLSHEQNAHAPIPPATALDMFMGGYKPDDDDAVNFAVFDDPKGYGDLPPVYF